MVILLILIVAGIFYFRNNDLSNVERCSLEPESGSCLARHERYYFDYGEGVCKQFFWGGCDGVVPFETMEDCQNICAK